MRNHNNFGQTKKGNVRHSWMRLESGKKCTACGVVMKLVWAAGATSPHQEYTKNGVMTLINPPCEKFDCMGNKI